MGLAVFVTNRYWYFNRFLRAVWVGDCYRTRALARLRYIWRLVLSPFSFKVLDLVAFFIRNRYRVLSSWYLVQVCRQTVLGLRVILICLIWHDVVGYLNRFGFRVITVNYLGLTSLAVPNFTGIWCRRPNDLRSIWQTYRLSLGILQGHRAAIKTVTCFYLLTVSQGDRLSSRNGVVTLISLSHHIDGHWNVLA